MKSEVLRFDRILTYEEIDKVVQEFDKGCVIMIHKTENDGHTVIEIQYI